MERTSHFEVSYLNMILSQSSTFHFLLLTVLSLALFASSSFGAPSMPIDPQVAFSRWAMNLALKYAPSVHFHSEEKFFPSPIDFYFDQVSLKSGDNVVHHSLTRQKLLETIRAGPTTGMTFANKAGHSDILTNFFGQIYPWMHGHSSSAGHNYPMYITLRQVSHREYMAYYYAFFPFNEGKGGVRSGLFGNHLGDWEHIRIKFVDAEPTEMLFHWHSDGLSIPFSDPRIEKVDGTHPIIYCAKGSHGFNFQPVDRDYHVLIPHLLSLTDHFNEGHAWNTWQDNPEVYFKRSDTEVKRIDNNSPADGDIWKYQGLWGTRQTTCVSDACPIQFSDGPETPHFDT
ncbi:hypothetical protein BKA69DRAFT_20869 [Paraphysoderma sedebokerense]|nr:hypothetical protein BKA69DRAFT_20869 [Paraphysoderma sedebokerense]